MPKRVSLLRSDAHKIACLSVYRALLRQSNVLISNLPTSGTHVSSSALRGLISSRFRRDRLKTWPRSIYICLNEAHSTLTLLRNASSGSHSAITTLQSTLRTHLSSEEATLPATPPSLNLPTPPKPTASILTRPLPLANLTQPRRAVPHLRAAQNMIPLLSYPGHNPRVIDQIVNEKLKWMERQFEHKKRLEILSQLGWWEDDWDSLILRQQDFEHPGANGNIGSGTPRLLQEVGWASATREVDREISAAIRQKQVKMAELGTRFWSIVKRERKMKEWEELPLRVAHAISVGMKLEWKVMRWAKRVLGREMRPLRERRQVVSEIWECRSMGLFAIEPELTRKYGEINWEKKEDKGWDLGRRRNWEDEPPVDWRGIGVV